MECTLLKMGIDQSEFTTPMGGGRVQVYLGNGGPGANLGSDTPHDTSLWGAGGTLSNYDMVLAPCQGSEYPQTARSCRIWSITQTWEAGSSPRTTVTSGSLTTVRSIRPPIGK